MEDITIRRAKAVDLPEVTKLWKEMMDYHLSLDIRFSLAPGNDEAYLEYLHSILENYDYSIFVAESKTAQRLAGYAIVMILSNPPIFSLPRYGFIAEMAVTESLQREGVGKRLWEHVRRWFHRRGTTVIQLNVSPLNKKGYNFWKKVGCTEFLHIMWHDIPKNP